MGLVHGGRLSEVAKLFNKDSKGWLDLSTGISPFSYPIPEIPISIWRDLPQSHENLLKSACDYYGAEQMIATNGSQSAIQALPKLWLDLYKNQEVSRPKVLLPKVGYKEHEKTWKENGFLVEHYEQLPQEKLLVPNTILVVINPNNPTGELLSYDDLAETHKKFLKIGGWLIVDEAFMDVLPKKYSMLPLASQKNIFVLRSIGKFFGLAGLRLGFVACHQSYSTRLNQIIGLWQINAPAILIAEKALLDHHWHKQQLQRLTSQTNALKELLRQTFVTEEISGTVLFVTVKLAEAELIYQKLCQQKVYVRLCDEKNALRFGIPDNTGLGRLQQVFDKILG